ncbi:hypothetical protein EDD18DRAFT_758278 [Armillaria luteobubalina]|uniref:Uncharacterized protein n=1 Tax=Armillaria luteobubalina TaxID=153913 RepID=A0AA39UDQ4_9AGAR|nr:hypothetical protein EDD18DRAFT_758278 [Armillaria luteobubalina]
MVRFAERASDTIGGLSTGAIVGIAVGPAVGVIVLIIIGILLFCYIRKRRQARKASSPAGRYKELILTDGGPGVTSPPPDWIVTPFSHESTPASPRPMSAYAHPSPSLSGQGTYVGVSESAVDRILSPPPSYPVDTPDSGGIMSVTERRSPTNRDEKKRESRLTASSMSP